ncbi:MAG: SDR family oxidoreductase [Verrucomicrobiales bacterium]|nr:SDR family oxidoreductase [Verrucomicrobiales bacterium]
MRILILGGTGIISTACTRLAIERGHDVYLLNRGQHGAAPDGAQSIIADLKDEAATAAALGSRAWDVVLDFIAFEPGDIERDLRLFRGRTAQYIFISSASAYQRPVSHYLITESTPLANPYWDYSRQKIACEERLMRAYREEAFPVTIIRPSLTYGETMIPLATNCWTRPWTLVDRLRRGQPVVVPGDGTSLWTITHNTDFARGLVGLLGHRQSIGHAFHITSDEVLCWNQCYEAVAEAAGVARPQFIHIASDFIAACLPEMTGSLLGDKATSVVLDNTKIRRFVPDYVATTRFRDGVARSIAWFDADPSRQVVDLEHQKTWDKLIAVYQRGLSGAKSEFGR